MSSGIPQSPQSDKPGQQAEVAGGSAQRKSRTDRRAFIWLRLAFARPSHWRSALGVLAIALLGALASSPELQTVFGSFDKVHFDLTGLLFPAKSTHKVVLIGVDAKTIRELGVGPVFERQTHAALMGRLTGAASITFDLLFPVPGPRTYPLAHAIQRNGHVVIPLPSEMTGTAGKPLMPASRELCTGIAGVGQHLVTLGHYGAVTGVVPYLRIGERTYPHVSLEAIRVAEAAIPEGDPHRYALPRALSVGDQMTESLMLMLPRPDQIERYSYVDVLKGRVPDTAFSGKLVFIGHEVLNTGTFKLSSLNLETVSQAELDALVAESLLDGGLIQELSQWFFTTLYVVLALTILSICALTPGRRMHWFALAWGGGVALASTLLLGMFRIWVPVGALVACGMLIYGVFASSRLDGTLRLLRREIRELREISSAVVLQDDPAAARGGRETALGVRNDIQAAMQQIRSWQAAYVNVINLLPYPIFLEQAGRIVLCNDKASHLVALKASFRKRSGEAAVENAEPITIAAVQALAEQHRIEAGEGGVEIELNGVSHMLLCVSFEPDADPGKASTLICLVDISSVKEAVTHDRQVLRHMAHDLRNPLSTILSLLDTHRAANVAGAPVQDDKKLIGELHRLADYSLRVAQDFMQLSRAEHLDADQFSPVPLVDLLVESIDNIAAAAEQKRIELDGPICDGGEVFVLANRNMLMRAVINLIDNAIKYSPPDTRIALTVTHQAGGRVAVDIADQGMGIPDDALPQLFDPFFQVDDRRCGRDGVGLGLPFVKTVIERLGGAVSIVSTLDKGSTFRISLPEAEFELGEDEAA
jgi:signal transduction histidine kinase